MTDDRNMAGELEPGPVPKEASNLSPPKEKERERQQAVFDQMQETPEQVKQRVANETIEQKPADYDPGSPLNNPAYQGVAPIRPTWPPIDQLKTAMPESKGVGQTQEQRGMKPFNATRERRPFEVYGARPASTAAELHAAGDWPADDQPGSAGPPPGFEPDDPEEPPPAQFPTYMQEYQGNTSNPPEGFEPFDPDAPPPPDIHPSDPLYQGPVAETPPGFEPFPQPGDPGFGEEIPPDTTVGTMGTDWVQPLPPEPYPVQQQDYTPVPAPPAPQSNEPLV